MSYVLILVFFFILSGSFVFKKNNSNLSITNSTEIKGISAILIVLGHCTNVSNIPNITTINFGDTIVALFFFISGYGITIGYKNRADYLSGFLSSRIVKVMVPFLLAHIIYIPLKLLLGYSFSLDTVFESITCKKTIVDYSWYCSVIIIMYILFWASFKYMKTNRSRFIALIIGVILFTVAEAAYYKEYYRYLYFSNFQFVLGVAFALFDFSKIKNYKRIIIGALGIALSYSLLSATNFILKKYSIGAEIIFVNFQRSFLIILIVSLIPIFQYNNRITTFIGKLSYEIYLYHGLFILIYTRISIINNNFIFLFILVCLSTICLSVVMNFANKKVIDFILKLAAKKRQLDC